MNIIIPEDENYSNVVIDFRDVVYPDEFAENLGECIISMGKKLFVLPNEEITTSNMKKYFKLFSAKMIKNHLSSVLTIYMKSLNLESNRFVDFSGEMKVIFIPKNKKEIVVGVPCGECDVQNIKITLKKDGEYYYMSVDSDGIIPVAETKNINSYIDGCGMDKIRNLDLSEYDN